MLCLDSGLLDSYLPLGPIRNPVVIESFFFLGYQGSHCVAQVGLEHLGLTGSFASTI